MSAFNVNVNEKLFLIRKTNKYSRSRLSFSVLIAILLSAAIILYIKVFFVKHLSVFKQSSLSDNLNFKRFQTVHYYKQEFRLGILDDQVLEVEKFLKNDEDFGQIVDSQRNFPNGFQWGVGSSSYQIEGAYNLDGKGESIWDYQTHNHPERIDDGSNADVTSDSYHQWQRDVEMIRELGVDIYRFSISWPRIMPNGFMNGINKAGIRYYNNLINELLKYNITPMVTMYHWELPHRLQQLGGWTNPEVVENFVDYARVLLEQFGDRIKFWTTFNEPWHICVQAYGMDYMAPSMNFPGIPEYLCGHNLLKAHAEVYHMYKTKFADQKGIMGITVDISWPEPKTNSADDKEASEIELQFYIGWFMHPIYSKTGNYPQIMIDRIGALSRQQGFTKSRLPTFTQAEIERLKNTSDFFGINSYTSNLVTKNDRNNSGGFEIPSFQHDVGVIPTQDPAWPTSGSVWLRVVPFGMHKLLKWIRATYDNPPVYVTENGVSDKGGTVDNGRVFYFNSYLEAVLDAVEEGCNVKGYIAWSLMDSFEWKAGFTEKFGLYHVNFKHPNRTRTAKMSARVYSNIVRTNRIDWNYKPEPEEIIPGSSSALKFNSFLVFLLPSILKLFNIFSL